MNPDSHLPNAEERVETVLAALRDAKAAPGMEQRIAAALLRAADANAPAKSPWAWLREPRLAGASAGVTAVALLLSVYAYRQSSGRPADRRIASAASASPAQNFTGHPNAVTAQRTPPPSVPAEAADGPAAAKRRQTARVSQPETAAAVGEQAATEQGFPAPPLPLTEQERLLIRLVHRDDPVQLAQLTPAARESELQRDHEQVREFFKAPPIPAANFKLEPYPVTGGSE